MPAGPRACVTIALFLSACAAGPGSPTTSIGPAGDDAAYWRARAGECGNVGDVLQRRKCLDAIDRERERAGAARP